MPYRGEMYVAKVDDEDYDHLCQFRWHGIKRTPTSAMYARRTVTDTTTGKRFDLRMHRVIMGAKAGQMVDHVDGDGLNNQRRNLRFVTVSQSACNKPVYKNAKCQYRGVYPAHKRPGVYIAQIKFGSQRHYLGLFLSEISAAEAYDAKAKELHGEYARLNFPQTPPSPQGGSGGCTES
jgi:hypothetical protein